MWSFVKVYLNSFGHNKKDASEPLSTLVCQGMGHFLHSSMKVLLFGHLVIVPEGLIELLDARNGWCYLPYQYYIIEAYFLDTSFDDK
jgi:hypothetical protein